MSRRSDTMRYGCKPTQYTTGTFRYSETLKHNSFSLSFLSKLYQLYFRSKRIYYFFQETYKSINFYPLYRQINIIFFLNADLYQKKTPQPLRNQGRAHRVIAGRAREKVQRLVRREKKIVSGWKARYLFNIVPSRHIYLPYCHLR